MFRSLTLQLTLAGLFAALPFAASAQFADNFDFTSSNSEPVGTPLFSTGGNIFGVTYRGPGPSSTCTVSVGCGTFFELVKPTTTGGPWTINTIYAFKGGAGGTAPNANPIYINGNFFGTTFGGGSGTGGQGHGTVYAMLPQGGGAFNHQVIYNFQGNTDGSHPTFLVALNNALYGITNFGGISGPDTNGAGTNCCGVVYQLTPPASGSGAGWTESVIYRFTGGNDGAFPQYIAINGSTLYVSTSNGGSGNGGTIVQLTSNGSSWNATTLYSFSSSGNSSFNPEGFTFDTSGNIFGVNEVGGGGPCSFFHYNGCGAVFELQNGGGGTWNFTQIYAFQGGPDGNAPFAPPVFDSNGNLYVTSTGLSQSTPMGNGAIVELTPGSTTWTANVLHTFNGTDGADPAGMLKGNDGNLYGFATFGGASDNGSLYSVPLTTPTNPRSR